MPLEHVLAPASVFVRVDFQDFLKRWLLVSNEGKVTPEQVDNEYTAFAQELKWSLIKGKIGEDNQVKVEHEEVLKQAKDMIMAQFGISNITEEMQETMQARLVKSYIALDALSITDFQFSKIFNEAIESKQTAEQLALKAQRDLERVKIEGQQKTSACE